MDLLGASSITLFLGAMAVINLRIVLKFFRVDMGCPQGFVCQDTVHGSRFRIERCGRIGAFFEGRGGLNRCN